MFPDDLDSIHHYPNAQYGVSLVFDRMVISASIELARDAEEEANQDEDSLTERAIREVTNILGDHYGLNVTDLGIQDAELTLEGVSV
jgi:predicted Zn-dependent protease